MTDVLCDNTLFGSFMLGGDLVSVKLHCPNGSPMTADVEDNDDGTYSATFIPVTKGDHQITVHVRGKPIQGSPFDLQVWKTIFYLAMGIS